MDQILKARRLGSASARRRRMQEREIAAQQAEERRTKILLYGYSSEEDELSEEGDSYSPIRDTQSDQARPPSSLSPSAKRPSTDILDFQPEQLRAPSLPFLPSSISKPYIPALVIPSPLAPDLNTYRGEPILPADDAGPLPFSIEPETPIEVATPIAYSIPHTRPSMIFIKTCISPRTDNAAAHRPASMPHPPPIPPRSDKRESTQSLSSAISSVEARTISLPLLSGQVWNDVGAVEREVCHHPPATTSVKSETALQCPLPSYDIFPRRSKMASGRKIGGPMSGGDQAQSIHATSPILPNTRRVSSFPTGAQDSESRPNMPLIPEDHSKMSTSTIRKRRSSIGLALRTASSSLRGKAASSRPTTSSSAGSVESKDCANTNVFPLPPPSPHLHQSSRQEPESRWPVGSGGSSRLQRVRTTMGL